MAIFRQKDCDRALKTASQLAAVSKVLAKPLQRRIAQTWQRAAKWVILVALCLTTSCAQSNSPVRLLELPDRPTGNEVRALSGDISEVAPPAIFLDLANLASNLQPHVVIAYPKPDQTLTETKFTPKIRLSGLSIYKEEKTQLGPHLKAILDNQPAQDIYNLDEPITFSELLPGSHTLRVFAVLPWGESFKNTDAYAQTTFHILAPTAENTPDPNLPLLTYNEPQGTFGAQPVLLDFYLNNAPLHLVATENTEDSIQDWRIRCTVNGQTFLFNQWQPVYLKGLKLGQNWVQISLINEQGELIDNAFNSTIRLVNYDPETKDTLSKLVRGELLIEQIGQIVVSDYEPPAKPLPLPMPIENADEPLENTVDLADPSGETDIERETEPDNFEYQKDMPEDKNNLSSGSDESRELVPEKLPPEEDEFLSLPDDLEETESLKENLTIDGSDDDIPNELAAPAAETDIDFSSQSEDTAPDQDEGFEASEDAVLETELPEMHPLGIESTEAELTEAKPITKPGFLEKLKTRWSAFQKAQIESQSETIQPAKAPIDPSIQLYTIVEDPREDMEYSADPNEPIDAAEGAEGESMNTLESIDSEPP